MPYFLSKDKQIETVQFEPRREGRFPALLILHGANGPMSTFIGDYAQSLANIGYVVFFVHYFDATNTYYADGAEMQKHFRDWVEVLQDAIGSATKHSKVDPERVGLIGYSLGGFLALSVASQDPRVSAVVSVVGGIPEAFAQRARRMPPVLILHGANDMRVPVKEAQRVEELLKRLHTPYELKIYQGQGHFFHGSAQIDALTRTFAFLQKHLHRKSPLNVFTPLLSQLVKAATS
jgi:dienelactone hydrolase